MIEPIHLLAQTEEVDEQLARNWPEAALIFGIAIALAVLLRYLVVHAIERSDSERIAANLVGRFVAYIIVIGGFVYALRALEAPLAPLLGALGIGGIAIAFALQDIIENFIAGIMLQVRRPFRRGDQILTNDYEGTVEDVNLRVVAIRTYDGERVFVPNGMVLKNPITNHTALGRRRTTLQVGVAYHSDLDRTREVLLEALRGIEDVRPEPQPEAYVEAFGASSIDLAVRFWHAPDIATLWRVRDEAARRIKRGLDDADIEIPFPQITLSMHDSASPMQVAMRSDGDG